MRHKLSIPILLLAWSCSTGPWNTQPGGTVVALPRLIVSNLVVAGRPFDTLWLQRSLLLNGATYDSTRSFVDTVHSWVRIIRTRTGGTGHRALPPCTASCGGLVAIQAPGHRHPRGILPAGGADQVGFHPRLGFRSHDTRLEGHPADGHHLHAARLRARAAAPGAPGGPLPDLGGKRERGLPDLGCGNIDFDPGFPGALERDIVHPGQRGQRPCGLPAHPQRRHRLVHPLFGSGGAERNLHPSAATAPIWHRRPWIFRCSAGNSPSRDSTPPGRGSWIPSPKTLDATLGHRHPSRARTAPGTTSPGSGG
jgi:hypothetical protein